jgi:hypothetical protein
MPRGNLEQFEVVRGATLTNSATTRITTPFPLGEVWTRMLLRVNLVLTIGTGTGAISEGELRYIKSIRISTDRGEMLVNNVPGRLLYRIDSIKAGTPAVKDAVAAATGTYRVPLVIWFWDPLANVPEDTLLNTARYSSLTVEVGLGAESDLLTTVGTATVATNLDIIIERERGRVPQPVAPQFFQEIGFRGPVDPTTLVSVDMERSANMAFKRLYPFATSGALVGVPFSGAVDDTIISDLTIDVDSGNAVDRMLSDIIQRGNKQDYSLETRITGLSILDLMKDGSIQSLLYSGDKSRLAVKWTNLTGLPATPQVTIGYEAIRPLF